MQKKNYVLLINTMKKENFIKEYIYLYIYIFFLKSNIIIATYKGVLSSFIMDGGLLAKLEHDTKTYVQRMLVKF